MKPILEIQNIGKKYSVSHLSGQYMTMRERLLHIFQSKQSQEDFWALQDVSFTVNPGESLGIIGSNGAGKSTLLKVLSKITFPSTGRMVARGRMASLLEVGTGFHPELTGRENVFFNGSLLGMTTSEIKAKFDEIVDFSGVEKFLDTPLKHYSSGMQLRLAFAVAAFLEPEILVIDEVLAVGDAEFQRKCMGKMEDVHNGGRTILFVSHNLDAVESLCQKCIWMDRGRLIDQGPSKDMIAKYTAKTVAAALASQQLTDDASLEGFSVDGVITSRESLQFSLKIRRQAGSLKLSDLALLFYNYKKQRVAIYDMRSSFASFMEDGPVLSYSGVINRFNLIEGEYYVGLYYGINGKHGDIFDLAKVQVREPYHIDGIRPYDVQYRGFVELK
jgi:ABC-type polysaccharide/polyol phosphate transport system ATPase subunit